MTPDEQAQFLSLISAILYPQVPMSAKPNRNVAAVELAAELYVAAQAKVKATPIT